MVAISVSIGLRFPPWEGAILVDRGTRCKLRQETQGYSWCSVDQYSCDKTVGWIQMSLGKEVDPNPGRIVLDGDPAPNSSTPHLRAMHIVAKRWPISATAELLHSNTAINLHQRRHSKMVIVLRPQMCDVTSSYLLDECLDCGKRRAIFGERTCPHMSEDNVL